MSSFSLSHSLTHTDALIAFKLGDMIKQRGVCRHRCLLFKLICDNMCENPSAWAPGVNAQIADQLAIRCALVRGGLDRPDNRHVWLLVHVDSDSAKVMSIVDLTNGSSKDLPYSVIRTDSSEAARYIPTIPLPVGNPSL
jgi:hypothetical protein